MTIRSSSEQPPSSSPFTAVSLDEPSTDHPLTFNPFSETSGPPPPPSAPGQRQAREKGPGGSSTQGGTQSSALDAASPTPLLASTEHSTIPFSATSTLRIVNVTFLDAHAQRFNLSTASSISEIRGWTVRELKRRGEDVHGIGVNDQRLIFRGKNLDDRKLLGDYNVCDDNGEILFHLYPKPRITVVERGGDGDQLNGEDNNAIGDRANDNSTGGENGANGTSSPPNAHRPIILVQSEASAREFRSRARAPPSSSINSYDLTFEIMENQRRIRVFSAILILICSMQLLTLFTVMLGIQGEVTTTGGSNSNEKNIYPYDPAYSGQYKSGDDIATTQLTTREWRNSDYIDLIINICGVYVGTLGLKATRTEEAKHAITYFFLLLIVGSSWVTYSYSSSYRISLREAKTEYNKNTNNDYNIDDDFNYSNSGINRGELASNALFACLFSGLIWAFCFCRAGAYARDLRRRDRDREARIREELAEQAGRDANQGEFSATAGTLVVV